MNLDTYYYAVFIGGIIGVVLHIGTKVEGLKNKFPNLTKGQILGTFFAEEWNVLIISAVVNISCLISVQLGAIHYFGWDQYQFGPLVAFVLMIGVGYFGQRVVYRVLGTTEKILNKKIDDAKK